MKLERRATTILDGMPQLILQNRVWQKPNYMYIIIFLKLFKVYSIKRQLQANLHEWQPPISDHYLSRTPKYSQSSLRIGTSFKWPPPVSDNNRVSWLTDLFSKVTPTGLILVKWPHLVSVHRVCAFWVVAYKRFDSTHRRKFSK